jgi:RimJ/RimL family protein N-acetyltransferase
MSQGQVPRELRTERLYLRPGQRSDAPALLPVLEANREHLSQWIPSRVAEPVPVDDLADRLSGFAQAFDAGREWRFAIISNQHDVLGEASLFPRDARERVSFTQAERTEIGYWVRADWTGRGIATETTRRLIDLVSEIPRFRRVEIRCDSRNAPSAAIPRRLGFELEPPDPGGHNMTWYRDLPIREHPDVSSPARDRSASKPRTAR